MKSYLELKIVATNLSELERLIREYEALGFVHDGYSQNDGNLYWTFLKINNDLIEAEIDDADIIKSVDRLLSGKLLTGYKKINEWLDRDSLINYVISKKDKYDPNKGNFDGFFGTIAKSYIISCYGKYKKNIGGSE